LTLASNNNKGKYLFFQFVDTDSFVRASNFQLPLQTFYAATTEENKSLFNKLRHYMISPTVIVFACPVL